MVTGLELLETMNTAFENLTVSITPQWIGSFLWIVVNGLTSSTANEESD